MRDKNCLVSRVVFGLFSFFGLLSVFFVEAFGCCFVFLGGLLEWLLLCRDGFYVVEQWVCVHCQNSLAQEFGVGVFEVDK